MNRKIRRMKEDLEQRGATIHIDETLPDAVVELFLKEILSCPDCIVQSSGVRDGRTKSTGH